MRPSVSGFFQHERAPHVCSHDGRKRPHRAPFHFSAEADQNRLGRSRHCCRVGGIGGLSDDLGARRQGRDVGPCRAAGCRHSANRQAGHQGPRLYNPHAGDGERRSVEPLSVAIQRDRRRGCQHCLYEVRRRPQCPAGYSSQQIQVLGPDDPALHQGRLSGRPQGVDPRSRSVQCALRDRSGRAEILQRSERLAHRHPDDHQCRYARHSARSGRAADFQLGRPDQPRVQGQGGFAGSTHGRGHRCRWQSRRAAICNTKTRAT